MGKSNKASDGEQHMSSYAYNYLGPCSYNDKPVEFRGFYERAMTKDKANNLDGYMELLGDYFDKLEYFPTIGYGRRPYPYQWRATSILFLGDEDVWEGLGKSPLEAVRDLYKKMKNFYQEGV